MFSVLNPTKKSFSTLLHAQLSTRCSRDTTEQYCVTAKQGQERLSPCKFVSKKGILEKKELRGIIPRTIDYIFHHIDNSEDGVEFSVKFEYLEVYNEKINDLIDPINTNLAVKIDEKNGGSKVQNLTAVDCFSAKDLMGHFLRAQKNRSVSETRMNQESSRSHSVCILTVFQRNSDTEEIKTGKLYLVDLAGSESLSKTEAKDETLEQAKFINKSLSALSMVMTALSEKKPFIPYNESKLTKILKTSLGGNSLTTMVIAGSLSSYNERETLSTLRFGSSAKKIKNKPVANSEKSVKELLRKIENLEQKIKMLEDSKGLIDDEKSFSVLSTEQTGNQSISFKKCTECASLKGRLLNSHIDYNELDSKFQAISSQYKELETDFSEKTKECYEAKQKLLQEEVKSKIIQEDLTLSYENIIKVINRKLVETNDRNINLEDMREKVEDVKIKNYLGKMALFIKKDRRDFNVLMAKIAKQNLVSEFPYNPDYDVPLIISKRSSSQRFETFNRVYQTKEDYRKLIDEQRTIIFNLEDKLRSLTKKLKDSSMEEELKVKMKEKDELIENLTMQLQSKLEEFDDFKDTFIKDLDYKQRQILNLMNKSESLEEENFRIKQSIKDKGKRETICKLSEVTESFKNQIKVNDALLEQMKEKDLKIEELKKSLHSRDKSSFYGEGSFVMNKSIQNAYLFSKLNEIYHKDRSKDKKDNLTINTKGDVTPFDTSSPSGGSCRIMKMIKGGKEKEIFTYPPENIPMSARLQNRCSVNHNIKGKELNFEYMDTFGDADEYEVTNE